MTLKPFKSFLLSSALVSLPLGAQEPTLNPGLLKAASKIDMGASFIELNDARSDLETLKKYGSLILGGLREMDPSTPEIDLGKLIDETGLGAINATATSNTKIDDLWLNKIYIENGGSRKGFFSMMGGDPKDFSVLEISPSGTDIALQLEIHLDQVPGILRSVAGLFEMQDEAEKGLNGSPGPLAMTGAQMLGKFKTTLNLAIDFDDEFNAQFIGRMDGLNWILDERGRDFFDDNLEDLGISYRKAKVNGHDSYEVLAGMEQLAMIGSRPFLLIDETQNQIWLASSKAYFEQTKDAKLKLKNNPEFVKTWSGMPQAGNSMAYFSNDILKRGFAMGEMFLLSDAQGDGEQSFQGILVKALANLIPAESGIALAIANDQDGVLATAKLPMPSKHLEWMSTQMATMVPMMFFGMGNVSTSGGTVVPYSELQQTLPAESQQTLPAESQESLPKYSDEKSE